MIIGASILFIGFILGFVFRRPKETFQDVRQFKQKVLPSKAIIVDMTPDISLDE